MIAQGEGKASASVVGRVAIMKVTRLEELLQRFDLRLVEVRMGVDDNIDRQEELMAVADPTPPGSGRSRCPPDASRYSSSIRTT